MRHYRVLGILLMLENHGVMTAKALAEHFEVSVRTIYRDVACLSEAGYGLVTESGKGGGIWLQHAKRIRVSSMDENELVRLVDKLALSGGKDLVDQNLRLKIRGQLPSESQAVFDTLLSRVIVDDRSWYGAQSSVSEEYMTLVQRAILHEKKIQVVYEKVKGQGSMRVIWPQGMVKKAGQVYVVGFCELREEMRTFRLSKMTQMTVLEESFVVNDTFDLRRYWQESVSAFSGVWGENRQVRTVEEAQEVQDLQDVQVVQVVQDVQQMKYPVTLRSQEDLRVLLTGFFVFEIEPEVFVCDLISEGTALAYMWRLAGKVEILSPRMLVSAVKRRGELLLSGLGDMTFEM